MSPRKTGKPWEPQGEDSGRTLSFRIKGGEEERTSLQTPDGKEEAGLTSGSDPKGRGLAAGFLGEAPKRGSQAEGGRLYVIATPIGNLEDITLRALHLLSSVDVVAAEDTRHTGLLLKAWGIKKPLISCFEHNEKARSAQLLALLREGRSVALVSDAGLPGISDPGGEVIRAVVSQGLPLTVIPGPSAGVTALVASGLSAEGYAFAGFLPRENKARRQWLACYGAFPKTLVLYESPYRLLDTLELLQREWGDRPACVARELTKRYEEFCRGSLSSLAADFAARPGGVRGEIVLVVGGRETLGRSREGSALRITEKGEIQGAPSLEERAGYRDGGGFDPGIVFPTGGEAGCPRSEELLASRQEEQLLPAARKLLDQGLSKKEASRRLAELSGRPKKELYALLVELSAAKE